MSVCVYSCELSSVVCSVLSLFWICFLASVSVEFSCASLHPVLSTPVCVCLCFQWQQSRERLTQNPLTHSHSHSKSEASPPVHLILTASHHLGPGPSQKRTHTHAFSPFSPLAQKLWETMTCTVKWYFPH